MDTPPVDLELARGVLSAEGGAIRSLSARIGPSFEQAAREVYACAGKVVLTGVGKAGIIAQKVSATLASTGASSIFLHPVEALHGDIGRVQRGDVVLVLSHSGASEEIVRLLDHLKARGSRLIAVTGRADSPLGRHADVTVCYGPVEEACPHGLAPTVSTSCMLALGDALALVVMRMRDFQPEDFAAFHPAGDLGRKLLKVEQAMTFRKGERLKVVSDRLSLGEALAQAEELPRRSGAMVLVDDEGRLTGIITDADLRRALVKQRGSTSLATSGSTSLATGGAGATPLGGADMLLRPVREFMIANPKRVRLGDLASEALAIMNRHRIDELPVVDDAGRAVGLIDVQDLLGIKTLAEGDASP